MSSSSRARLLELFKARAVSFGRFTLASGKESTYYINSKKALFNSEAVWLLGDLLWELTKDLGIQAMGGLEVGAIPMFPWAMKWDGLVSSPDGVHEVTISLFGSEQATHLEPLTAGDRRKLEASADGRAFLWFARFPAICDCGGHRVAYDARFTALAGSNRDTFAVDLGDGRWVR